MILAAIVLWAASYPLWSSTTKWELALHTGSARSCPCSCWSSWRTPAAAAEEAAQEKLNVIAEALSDLMASRATEDADLQDSVAGCARRSASRSGTTLVGP